MAKLTVVGAPHLLNEEGSKITMVGHRNVGRLVIRNDRHLSPKLARQKFDKMEETSK